MTKKQVVRILLVEDEGNIAEWKAEIIRELDKRRKPDSDFDFPKLEFEEACTKKDALDIQGTRPVQIILADNNLSAKGGAADDGFQIIKSVRDWGGDVPSCFLITGKGMTEDVKRAHAAGALHFYTKDHLDALYDHLYTTLPLHIEAPPAKHAADVSPAFDSIMVQVAGESFRSLIMDKVLRVARSDEPVIIIGETGTGKESIAHLIHEASRRKNKELVVLHLQGISHTLIRNEIFGYEKGAYTGAIRDHKGALERAHGSTLFLDEANRLDKDHQLALLRVIERKTVQRQGSEGKERPADFRLVVAMNDDPLSLLDDPDNPLLDDFYYRICRYPIHIPPLADRRGDISNIIDEVLTKKLEARDLNPVSFTQPAAKFLRDEHDWPGNVRELERLYTYLSIEYPGQRVGMDEVRAALDVWKSGSDVIRRRREKSNA